MQKATFLVLPVILVAALASAQVVEAPRSPESEPYFSNAIVGSAVTCSQQRTLVVPLQLVPNARLKARLLVLLRDSLYDDAHGILNIAREKEIRKLANKLKNARDDY